MNFALRLPDYYKEDINKLKGDISINQFIVNAIAQKIASLKTAQYLEERAKEASIEDLINILEKVDEKEPLEFDKL